MIELSQVLHENVNELTPKVKSLDASNVPVFKDLLRERVKDRPSLLLNLEHVEFLDSSGLGALIWLLREIEAQAGKVKLCNLQKPVLMLLEVVRMHRVFDIYSTPQEAMKSWAK
jgi:anti-sigma B factor antagonist